MYKTLLNLAKQSSSYQFIELNRVMFNFLNYQLIVSFKYKDITNGNLEDYIEESNYYSTFGEFTLEDIPSFYFDNIDVDHCFITDAKYLGDRTFNTNSSQQQYSISYKMHALVREINLTFPNIIINYQLDINFGYDDNKGLYCDGGPNYIFKIFLSFDSHNLKRIIEHLKGCNLNLAYSNSFYSQTIKEHNTLNQSYNLSIIGTNTKSRRIGYLILLSEFFSEFKKVPTLRTAKKFENYSFEYQDQLAASINNKGIIKISKSGISAKPYIDLSKELNWITNVHNLFVPGKKMLVYNVLKSQFNSENSNKFDLTKFDKLFFLEILISKDSFYLFSLLEILFDYNNPLGVDYELINNSWQNKILLRINYHIEELENERSAEKEKRQLISISNRIKAWKKPLSYGEHILMPRLNWLFDLGIVDFLRSGKTTSYKLTIEGEKLFKHHCIWNDINYGLIIDPTKYIRRFYVKTFADVYNVEGTTLNYSESNTRLKIDEYLSESFKYFRTLAPNRVNSSQAILYTKYKLYLTYNLLIDEDFIEDHIKSFSKDKYIYKYQEQYRDGYIQKK